MFGAGFLIAAAGHLFGSRAAVVAGLSLIFVGVVLLPLAIRLTL